MSDHTTVRVEELDADIDEQIVDLVLQFNGSGGRTVSSCQGDPGIIGEGGRYGVGLAIAISSILIFLIERNPQWLTERNPQWTSRNLK